MDPMTSFFFGNWATRSYLFAVAVTAVILIGGNLATGDHEPTQAAVYLIGSVFWLLIDPRQPLMPEAEGREASRTSEGRA